MKFLGILPCREKQAHIELHVFIYLLSQYNIMMSGSRLKCGGSLAFSLVLRLYKEDLVPYSSCYAGFENSCLTGYARTHF